MAATAIQTCDSASSSAGEPEIVLIPKEDVDRVAGLAGPLLEKGIGALRGTATATGLLRQCAEDHMQLWLEVQPLSSTVDVAIITELVRCEEILLARVVLACGSGLFRAPARRYLATLESWARFQGCDRIIIQGRAGWARYLPDPYEEIARVWERRL